MSPIEDNRFRRSQGHYGRKYRSVPWFPPLLLERDVIPGPMLETAARQQPSEQATNRVMTGRAILASSAIRTVDKAMEVAGGAAFYRELGLERRFRDVQAARFHPLQEKAQLRYAGRIALGLDIDG